MRERTPTTEFLWRAWGALGLSSWDRSSVRGVVDPEALIALTIARGDMRLVHETIDWAIGHASLLLVPRLRRYAAEIGGEVDTERWVATVAAHASGVTWTSRAPALEDFTASGKSHSMPTRGSAAPASAALRSRALLGAQSRTEVIRSFHPVLVGIHGPLSSHEVVWLTLAAKSQVNSILDDLVRGGFLERSGSERRRHYSPRIAPDDVLATSIWQGWGQLSYAPWRAAIPALAHLDQILVVTTEDQPTSSAVEAVVHYQAALPLLARIDSSLAVPMRGGSAAEVLGALRELAMNASTRVVELLIQGQDAIAGARPATLRVPTSSETQGSNPWRLRFVDGRPIGY